MTRYFFDLYNDVDSLDFEGKQFRDFQAAKANALREAREMMTESVEEGHLNLNHSIQVRDEAGKIIYVLRFGDAVSIIPAFPA